MKNKTNHISYSQLFAIIDEIDSQVSLTGDEIVCVEIVTDVPVYYSGVGFLDKLLKRKPKKERERRRFEFSVTDVFYDSQKKRIVLR